MNKKLFLLFFALLVGFKLLAQGPPDPGGAPIDGGLSILALAGAAYGIKRLFGKKNKE